MSENQNIDPIELDVIRNLEDFDLTMLISEIHDHGWTFAKRTLCSMCQQGPYPDMTEAKNLMQLYSCDPDLKYLVKEAP